MFDLKWIREHPEDFDRGFRRRGMPTPATEVLALDRRRREKQTELNELQARRNEVSRRVGEAMQRGNREQAETLKAEVSQMKARMEALDEESKAAGAELEAFLASLPNLPADDVPDGDETANREEHRWGEPPNFPFKARQHFEIGETLGGMDFELAARLSGARFVVLTGQLARLHRALAQFMLSLHVEEHGYTEVNSPVMVLDKVLYGTGQLPKFANDLFEVPNFPIDQDTLRIIVGEVSKPTFKLGDVVSILENEGSSSHGSYASAANTATFISAVASNISDAVVRTKLERASSIVRSPKERRWLIPTAEVTLTNFAADRIFDESALPLRLTAHTLCFRSEAGAAGKDTRGMLRQHQFEKVELVSICRPDQSQEEHERMARCAETVLELLELPYRRVTLSTGDMGFSARKTYDLEVWLPGQGTYREISSCSNCGGFQARRMQGRFRPAGAKETQFLHTLNGSGVAVGRALIAVLENYQEADGSVRIPEVLQPYMRDLEVLRPHG